MAVRREGTQLHRVAVARDKLLLSGGAVPPVDDELRSIYARIQGGVAKGEIGRSLEDLLSDYLHLQSVRLFAPWHEHPAIEPLSYVFLEKAYAARAALEARKI